MTARRCSRGTIMGSVGKDDDTNGGGGRRDEVAAIFGGAIEDEATIRFSS